ncbi:MAG: bifunctional glutamate N-acetyltransferase/amino-acid acetyltransferase ArgJ [Dehalococcoidales bacterium]|nr:bifunctional glutamate N-acetyltransferase/amino-acid acetyltransferase ArgJ [Dehalococcoidales bacterium]
MTTEADFVPSGGVTSPGGFLAGAVSAGIKYSPGTRLDLGILYSRKPCAAAAVFTTNKVKAAPVLLSRERLLKGRASAVVMNSGCANACTGKQGRADAAEMTGLAARMINVKQEDVLAASTGVIGVMLPMERIRAAIPKIVLTEEGGHDLARAIITTDRVPKEVAVRAGGFSIGGMMKGSGMIHPDMATMLCFLTTDAAVELEFLKQSLKKAVEVSFHMISVDGDNSTNDMVLIMANGVAGGETITKGSRQAAIFQRALNRVCIYLAREAVRDGEGATKLIEVKVGGALSLKDARLAARTIVSSSLVKAAVHGSDPNWGRVLAAAGRSGAALEESKAELYIGGTCLVKDGTPLAYDKKEVVKHLDGKEVFINLNLNLGRGEATAWGCDLSEEYVKINAEYTT